MAYPVYSAVFFAEKDFTVFAEYTVDPAYVAVIRDVDVCWGFGLTGAEFIFTGNAGQRIWVASFSPIDSTVDAWAGWRGRHVVAPGDSFAIEATSAVDVSVSGYLLTAP